MKEYSSTAQPTKATDRILYLDILRGIAILFIFLANIQYLAGTYFYSPSLADSFATAAVDHWLGVVFYVLIDGKFYSIFSILFGIGFVVQYNNLKKGSRPFVPFFTRRMLGLLLIGGIHLVFFWPGDILGFLFHFFYAMGVVPMACGIAAGIALIVIKRPKALEWIAPVGRTALSNYLFQTVIAISIFYGFGLGLTRQFGFSVVVAIALAVFAWQVVFSTVWLRYFRFGPVE